MSSDSFSGYRWRGISPEERERVLAARKQEGRAWHSPPHFSIDYPADFHITAACFEHQPIIGHSEERMEAFSKELLNTVIDSGNSIQAWCVLPNHYHILVKTSALKSLTHALGQLHGRNSFKWNGEEDTRGRQVFYRASDRAMRSDAHYWATVNYIHHNPVHHGYVDHWTDWPWSSAIEYLAHTGRDEAIRVWRAYPILHYGQGWDDADL